MPAKGKHEPGLAALLQSGKPVTVEEACQKLGVSQATARRLFSRFESLGLAERFWGGIRLNSGLELQGQAPVSFRQTRHIQEKIAIAREAANLVADGEVIIIDGGTTTVHMVPFLAEKPIRVITNSILVAQEFDHHRAKSGGPEVLVTGGMLYQELGLLTGLQTRENLKQYHASKAFISVGAIDASFATNHHQSIVETEKTMIKQARQLILLADHSKIDQTHMCRICAVSEADALVTNRHESTRDFLSLPVFQNLDLILSE
jgi:DeoR family myo-inositol catabolism operon transcriptional repressor